MELGCGTDSRPALLAGLAEVLARPKFATTLQRTADSPERMLVPLRMFAEMVDAPALALAQASGPDCIVSGEDDLLSPRQFKGIALISPAQALQLIESQ
jgi:predicted nucleic acid-binding protein